MGCKREWMVREIFQMAVLLLLMGGCQPVAESAREPVVPYDLRFDMKMLMSHVIEPAAEVPWDSAGEIVTVDGTQDLAPTDEEGWHHVEAAGATLVETGNLLLMPGRDRGTDDWRQFSGLLSARGHQVMSAAQAKDKDALFQAGADLYSVCVACHQVYVPELQTRPGDRSPGESSGQ